ncbi:MAG: 1-deoxy-D-xylulose-5-phosphate synthase [Nitrospira bacterium SM23_35]|jgi:1-deoxy-D-xylulose-5-phosphate synthase|nr:MAG: 1-deoxy-D-xylulose-5-phosphate synthase [Nitrospira bacterium SM23_35]
MHLEQITSPEDIKRLSVRELRRLAREIKNTIIERVSLNGGHLASNLGVIELTLALHYVFDSPDDKIIWDVGHQAYPHKLLTGRYSRFSSIRKYRGLSGFPKRNESEHDPFGTGHSSTSISAALGILEGRDKNNEQFKVIAVIGDGAMTGGLAFEGLNNAGHVGKDLIVILNDNEMSISKNVGALPAYLNRMLTGDLYQKIKKETKSRLESIPKVGGRAAKLAQKTEEMFKRLFLPGIIFEELGFTYVGPVDGHDVELLIRTLKRVQNESTPTLVHVITKKGRGYEFSEKYPSLYHGVGPFKLETGSPVRANRLTYSEIFGNILTELAERDPKIIAITAAMKEGTGLELFAKRHPDRFYDVGIAEQHAVTFAAGLATQGQKPFVAIYSTFLQRAYDQIIHDVCLQNLPVIFAIDRSGIVGEDGPTHHGTFDISYLRHIPNITVMEPKNETELAAMMELAVSCKGPVAIRYPRGTAESLPQHAPAQCPFRIGEAEILKEGKDVALIALGRTVYAARRVSEKLEKDGISAMVINARFVKPLDHTLLSSVVSLVPRIVTIEENALQGGFGSAILEFLNEIEASHIRVRRVGIPDVFVEQGNQNELRRQYGLDDEGIYLAVHSFLTEPTYTY